MQIIDNQEDSMLHYPYQKICKLGEGTYGKVYKCLNLSSNEVVAVKIIIQPSGDEYEGISSTTLREMSILKKLHGQPYIVELKDVILSKDFKQYLVFEYIEEDLRHHIEHNNPLNPKTIQRITFHLLMALFICHSNRIFHRDLKPANVLVGNGSVLKLADFGLAKHFGHPLHRTHTKEVQTLWYRAPELLLDLFSVGCIIGEMLHGIVMFRGSSEIDQLFKIFDYMGTPEEGISSDYSWDGLSHLPHYTNIKFPKFIGKRHQITYPDIDPLCIDLMHSLLNLDPKRRITAKDALKHRYFDSFSPQDLI